MRFEFIRLHASEYYICQMCRILGVSRQGYGKYLKAKDRPHKHAALLAAIKAILQEDEYNDTYGREHMRTSLVIERFKMAVGNYPVQGALCHSDRGSQYTSHEFREYAQEAGFMQSMSFAGSSCYGNAKFESMWARMKEEAIYKRHKTECMSMEAVKSLVFRYIMGYWNNRRISHAIGGMSPAEKRESF